MYQNQINAVGVALLLLLLLSRYTVAAESMQPAAPAAAITPAALLPTMTVGTLESITYQRADDGSPQLRLALSAAVPVPTSFSMDQPPRLVVDLPGVEVALPARYHPIEGDRLVRSWRVLQSQGRSRLVVELTRSRPYRLQRQGNTLLIVWQEARYQVEESAPPPATAAAAADASEVALTALDFRRGEAGAGQVVLTLSRGGAVAELVRQGDRLLVDLAGVILPAQFHRDFDVTDFATPISTIAVEPSAAGTRLRIALSDDAGDYSSYQFGDRYTIEVRPRITTPQATLGGREGLYRGDKLSFNFQNIEVRAVLQLIADFTGLNVVASDAVTGNITLRLEEVPWDQALDIILEARGLGMRRSGRVLLIAPNEEIAQRDRLALEAQQQQQQMVPLRTDYFAISYANAGELARLIGGEGAKLLSSRGSVTVDSRTNTLMVQDSADRLAQIAQLVRRLDVPIRQVLIESRIVIANDDFSRNLGVRAGLTAFSRSGNTQLGSSGSAVGNNTLINHFASGSSGAVPLPGLSDRLNVDMPVADAAGGIALAILGANYLVDLELSALQQEGKGEVVSSPRVITANQRKALIEQGTQIPYTTRDSEGIAQTSFKDATLKLEVTPQITPDDRVLMQLQVSKDSPGEATPSGELTINSRSVTTEVLVENGATVVLGGIHEQSRSETLSKVPLLGDLPLLGGLFRSRMVQNDKAELLIFVTPRILRDDMSVPFSDR